METDELKAAQTQIIEQPANDTKERSNENLANNIKNVKNNSTSIENMDISEITAKTKLENSHSLAAAFSSNNTVMSNLDSSIMAVSSQQTEMDSLVSDAPNNDAVAAVVAAIEQSQAAAKVNGTDLISNGPIAPTKSAKKKARTPSTNKNANTPSTVNSHLNNSNLNNSNNDNSLNTSPSSAQKRRKKDPYAPKAPLNGYLVYFNEERADMRSKNPQMGFGELTKIIATKWKELPAEDKQRYINEADVDKERYVREMADYKNSDAYKQYLKENSSAKMSTNGNTSENMHNNRMETPPLTNNTIANSNGGDSNLNWLQQESNIAGFDIPIFTEEFIDHSKNRESEMRLLRKEITEMEQQNNVLNSHIENLKQSTQKIETDIDRYKNSNTQMQKNADLFRQTILHCFNNIALPNTQEYPTPNNIDDYIMRIYSILNTTSQTSENSNESAYSLNRQFANHVKSVFSKINFNSLFDSI
jgi:hypothetical protein